jgi:CBS domain containing-hemolysin-like protein
MLLVLAVIGGVLLVNAFFVGSEFAAVSARRTRIEQLASTGQAPARLLWPVLADPERLDRYVAACQVGITLTGLILGFAGQSALAAPLSETLARLTGWEARSALALTSAGVLLALTLVQILMAELVPKAIAIRHPERVALLTIRPMRLSARLLAPFIRLFNGTATFILRRVGIGGPGGHVHLHSAEEIEILVTESARGGALQPIERQMLHNAFDLTQLMARQVMIPRNRLEVAAWDTPVEQLLRRLAGSPYSRLPLYRTSPDDIIGIVHLKDLFRLYLEGEADAREILRPVPAVPETLPVGELWQLLNQGQHYLAVVIDEYGGTAGIVTQEDLLEEVVGEVRDEFDVETEPVILRPGEPAVVRGDVLVTEVNDLLELDLPTDRADTVGGLILDELGRMARAGDVAAIGAARLRVESVRGNWIERVTIEAPPRRGRRPVDRPPA